MSEKKSKTDNPLLSRMQRNGHFGVPVTNKLKFGWQYGNIHGSFWPKTKIYNLRLSDHIVLARKIVQKAFFIVHVTVGSGIIIIGFWLDNWQWLFVCMTQLYMDFDDGLNHHLLLSQGLFLYVKIFTVLHVSQWSTFIPCNLQMLSVFFTFSPLSCVY